MTSTASRFDGRALRVLREQRSWTRPQLAEAAGCSWQTIRSWESGQRSPRADLLLRLATALGVEPEHFFDGDEVAA